MDLTRLVFVDESGAKTNMTRLYSRAIAGQRAIDNTPADTGVRQQWSPLFGSMAQLPVWSLTEPRPKTFLKLISNKILTPSLKAGDVVILDNLAAHKNQQVRGLIKSVGAELWYLPAYSPDLNPIEKDVEQNQVYFKNTQGQNRRCLDTCYCQGTWDGNSQWCEGMVWIMWLCEYNKLKCYRLCVPMDYSKSLGTDTYDCYHFWDFKIWHDSLSISFIFKSNNCYGGCRTVLRS